MPILIGDAKVDGLVLTGKEFSQVFCPMEGFCWGEIAPNAVLEWLEGLREAAFARRELRQLLVGKTSPTTSSMTMLMTAASEGSGTPTATLPHFRRWPARVARAQGGLGMLLVVGWFCLPGADAAHDGQRGLP